MLGSFESLFIRALISESFSPKMVYVISYGSLSKISQGWIMRRTSFQINIDYIIIKY